MKVYSLKKSTHILRLAYHRFQKKKKGLPLEAQTHMQEALLALQNEVMAGDQNKADVLARRIEDLMTVHLKKSGWDKLKEIIFGLAFALAVAVVIRGVWFEFYEIPSGSMRPTFREQDRLAVSKTAFGINVPLRPDEFYFNPDLVQRNGIVIFTGEGMDIRDVDTLYFYLFPGKKQYIKRMIGKPGDILYFYGGKIYGIDKEGKDISATLQQPTLQAIEHIPFIDFDRKLLAPPNPTNGIYSPIFIYQMNEPVVKLSVSPSHQVDGEIVVPPQIHAAGAPPVVDYCDLWGFQDFGMVRLLTKEQVKNFTDQNLSEMEEGLLYLEIRHHPSIKNVKMIRDEMGRLRPSIGLSSSIIPLQENHLKELMKHMYTARFEVKGGTAYRFGMDAKAVSSSMFLPKLPDVPDGCYEFYNGKATKILWQGISQELPENHPLYRYSPSQVQLLFNLGMEWDTRFLPQVKNQRLVPARYTYYRDQDLYLLGAPILKEADETLQGFLAREAHRAEASNPQSPYLPFQDPGPPLKNGELDVELLRQNGILIPEKSYLVLGDNHAMSADSRDFGFVPQENLRGAPDFIFWPPGSRFGFPNQPSYPLVNGPRTFVWLLAALCAIGGTIHWRKRNKLPLKFE